MDFETIYRQYFRDVYRYVRGLSQNEHLAEEIAQETFARALRGHRADLRKDRGLGPGDLLPGQKPDLATMGGGAR